MIANRAWQLQGQNAASVFLSGATNILARALDPQDEEANRASLGVFTLLFANRGAALSPFAQNVAPETVAVCCAAIRLGRELVARASTIKVDPSDPSFRLYAAQLNLCTFTITKAIIVRPYYADLSKNLLLSLTQCLFAHSFFLIEDKIRSLLI